MIDDGQGLRESRPDGAAEPEDRSNSDGFAAFTTDKPAVTVVIKRRRGGAQAVRVPHDGNPREERRPRVHQVRTSASTPGSPQPEVTLERDNIDRAGKPDPTAVVGTLPTRRRRARRDPLHAPGEVTRTVFEAPPPMPVAQRAESDAPPLEFIVQSEVGYEQVMAELQQLRAELDLALSARRFRIE